MSASAKATHESMTERKTILIDSLWRKFRTLAVSTQLAAVAAQGAGGSVSGSAAPAGVAAAAAIAAVAAPSDDDSETRLLSDVLAAMGAPDAEFTDTVAALEAWVNPADNAYALLGIEKALRANEPARALEILTKLLATPKVCWRTSACFYTRAPRHVASLASMPPPPHTQRVQADVEKCMPFGAATSLRTHLLRMLGWRVWAERSAEAYIVKYRAPSVLLM